MNPKILRLPGPLPLSMLLAISLPMAGCGSEAEASESSRAAQELREAQESLANWAELETEEFRASARKALDATDRRLTELRQQAAESEVADQVRASITELERQRAMLADEIDRLGTATGDALEEAKRSFAEGVDRAGSAFQAAWAELRDG